MVRCYESMVLIDPDLDQEGAKAVVGEIQDLIRSSGGEVVKVEEWGLRNLAYPIKKKAKAHYFLLYFKANGDFIKTYERTLELKEKVLRYLTLKHEKGFPFGEGESCSTSTG